MFVTFEKDDVRINLKLVEPGSLAAPDVIKLYIIPAD